MNDENVKLAKSLHEVTADQMIDALPEAWQDQLRPEVIKLLSSSGYEGEKAAEVLVKTKIAEWSLIKGQPRYRWDDDLGAIPSL